MPKIINKIVKILVTSDFFLNLGWGLVSPIFAIFILERISPQNPAEAVKIAGFAALFYWITKSFLEIPIGHLLDKKEGEKDDFWLMVAGLFIVSVVPIGLLFSYSAWHIYLLQMVHAIGMAMTLPSWLAIFTRHIDKKREGLEWGMETTSISIGAGIAGGAGGVMAAMLGFEIVFLFVSGLTVFSAVLLLLVRKNIYPKDGKIPATPEKPVVEP